MPQQNHSVEHTHDGDLALTVTDVDGEVWHVVIDASAAESLGARLAEALD